MFSVNCYHLQTCNRVLMYHETVVTTELSYENIMAVSKNEPKTIEEKLYLLSKPHQADTVKTPLL